jgi:hypothetical protein
MPHEKSRFPTVRDLYRALQYENPNNEKSLTSEQTAAIDIPSLLQSKSEYWIAPFGNTIKSKKIIIASIFFLATRIKKCCKQALTALGMSINSNNPVTAQEIKKSVGEKIKEENKSDSTATASATPK